MKVKLLIFTVALFIGTNIFSQEKPLDRFNLLVGEWQGTGEGFGASKSEVYSTFKWVLNQQFLEVKNHSEFESTDQNSKGEIHDDWGIISFDKARKVFVFRQFHVEGFVNQYVLNESLSTQNTFVFESEVIENFVPGGKARWTIVLKDNSEIETIFDIAMPDKDLVCYGKNKLKKK